MNWSYSLREAAEKLGVCHTTVKLWLAEIGCEIPEVERGKSIRVPAQIVERMKDYQLRKRGVRFRPELLRRKAS